MSGTLNGRAVAVSYSACILNETKKHVIQTLQLVEYLLPSHCWTMSCTNSSQYRHYILIPEKFRARMPKLGLKGVQNHPKTELHCLFMAPSNGIGTPPLELDGHYDP